MTIKIFYISEANIFGNSAYLIHTCKMCNSFSKKKMTTLITPWGNKNLFLKLKKKFLLIPGNKFKIIYFFKKVKKMNFFSRLIFAFKTSLFLKNLNEKKLIVSRSFLSSIFLIIFRVKHFLEIHHELKGLSKLFLINFNLINSDKILKVIFISKKLKNKFDYISSKKTLVMHDAVDLNNYNFKKNKKSKRKIVSYIGSFYSGRGIDLIINLAKHNTNLNFNLYGLRNEKRKFINLKNLKIYKFIEYKNVPKIIYNSDILLMPYSENTSINAKGINTAEYCSPLKMFDYLAGGKIILSSKLSGICEVLKNNKNSIIVPNQNLNKWNEKLNFILKDKRLQKKITKNAKLTAAKYTWDKRANLYLNNYVNSI